MALCSTAALSKIGTAAKAVACLLSKALSLGNSNTYPCSEIEWVAGSDFTQLF